MLWQGTWGHTVSLRGQQGKNTPDKPLVLTRYLQQTNTQPDTRFSPGPKIQAPTVQTPQQMKKDQQTTLQLGPAARVPACSPVHRSLARGCRTGLTSPHRAGEGWADLCAKSSAKAFFIMPGAQDAHLQRESTPKFLGIGVFREIRTYASVFCLPRFCWHGHQRQVSHPISVSVQK